MHHLASQGRVTLGSEGFGVESVLHTEAVNSLIKRERGGSNLEQSAGHFIPIPNFPFCWALVFERLES